jgi:hypothetical protein
MTIAEFLPALSLIGLILNSDNLIGRRLQFGRSFIAVQIPIYLYFFGLICSRAHRKFKKMCKKGIFRH